MGGAEAGWETAMSTPDIPFKKGLAWRRLYGGKSTSRTIGENVFAEGVAEIEAGRPGFLLVQAVTKSKADKRRRHSLEPTVLLLCIFTNFSRIRRDRPPDRKSGGEISRRDGPVLHCPVSRLPVSVQRSSTVSAVLLRCPIGALPLSRRCSSSVPSVLLHCPRSALPASMQCSSTVLAVLFHCPRSALPASTQSPSTVLVVLLHSLRGIFRCNTHRGFAQSGHKARAYTYLSSVNEC